MVHNRACYNNKLMAISTVEVATNFNATQALNVKFELELYNFSH
jgi:hypothetical protein